MLDVAITINNLEMDETTQQLAISAITKGRLPSVDPLDPSKTIYHFIPSDFEVQTPRGFEYIKILLDLSGVEEVEDYPVYIVMPQDKLNEEVPEGMPNRINGEQILTWNEYKAENHEFLFNDETDEVAIHSWSFGTYLTGNELLYADELEYVRILTPIQLQEEWEL